MKFDREACRVRLRNRLITWSWTLGSALAVSACAPSRESITAGHIGCRPSEITISEEATTMGVFQDAKSWVAECQGRSYVCSEVVGGGSQVSCREISNEQAEQSTQPIPTAREASEKPPAPPTSGAGFVFGATPEESQGVCEAAGHVWNAAGTTGSCSGPGTDLGLPGSVQVTFCKQQACAITVQLLPARTMWLPAIAQLKEKLTKKYGVPAEMSNAIPNDCRSNAEFVKCLEAGTVRLRYGWTWQSGERVTLGAERVDADAGTSAVLRLQYAKPPRRVDIPSDAL